MIDEAFMFREQTLAVYNVLKYLQGKSTLPKNPRDVEMTRENCESIYPCRRGTDMLDITQIEWAKKQGKWWFNGPIKDLIITNLKKEKLDESDMILLKMISEKAGINLILTTFSASSARRRRTSLNYQAIA